MHARPWLRGIAIAIGVCVFGMARSAKADEWGRYYHWPYQDVQQYQWSPYEYRPTYEGNYRYPVQDRVYPTPLGTRNWSTVRKPFYRGDHFKLDRF